MEDLNIKWFAAINAGANLQGYQLWFSIFAAKYLIYIVVLFFIGMWFWGPRHHRLTLLITFLAIFSALLTNWLISYIWFHSRPFMQGIGHTYLVHVPDSSFPSDHATGLFTMSFVFLLRRDMRGFGIIMLLLTSLVAWARIYVGIHFPFDMIGSLIVSSIFSVVLIKHAYFIERYLFPQIICAYQKLFSKPIKLKWINA